MSRFADLILPLAAPGTFTYRVPDELRSTLARGLRVVVQFGAGRRTYTGIVLRVHNTDPGLSSIRSVLGVLDGGSVVSDRQLELWERIADHYLCSIGELMLAALPGALVLSGSTRLVAGPADRSALEDPRDALLLDALERNGSLDLDAAGKLLGMKDPMPLLRGLIHSGHVLLAEELAPDTPQRMEDHVMLAPDARTEEALHAWFDRVAGKPKQLELLMRFVELGRSLTPTPRSVPRIALQRAANATAAQLRKLVDEGLFLLEQKPYGSTLNDDQEARVHILSPAQRVAFDAIRVAFDAGKPALLHGVTASGKTEVYLDLIDERLQNGEQVLYLLPEIALTTQIIGRIKARFGERVGVYHSRLSDRERVDLWYRMVNEPGSRSVIVGARSALLLPFTKLGLVIVDEEHDPSYKQQDPAPRYHARDMALVLAAIHGARTLLGSATPSLESVFNANAGKYVRVPLTVRHGSAALPTVQCVDLKDAQRRKALQGSFSDALLETMARAIERKEQVILFQNRRGYSPIWQCGTCGWVPECTHCDVSLTYHKADHVQRCHYCGRSYPPPLRCGGCGSTRLEMIGFGTERIEEELGGLLEGVRVARMDQDTTRGKHAFARLLERFAEGDLDVLVGTQMVTKGLDFGRVSVVGIMNADPMLRYPDMRAHERAFQLMAQVAGRSGRGKVAGTVLIQTREPAHPVLRLVMDHDADGLYTRELPLRQEFGYPPFSRMVRLTFKHREVERVERTAHYLIAALRPFLDQRVLGPEVPVVGRVRDLYIRNVLLKLDRGQYRREKEVLRRALETLAQLPEHRAVRISVDVDPA